MGVAVSDHPAGPFKDVPGKPLVDYREPVPSSFAVLVNGEKGAEVDFPSTEKAELGSMKTVSVPIELKAGINMDALSIVKV